MKDYWVDFQGAMHVQAENKAEAEKLFAKRLPKEFKNSSIIDICMYNPDETDDEPDYEPKS